MQFPIIEIAPFIHGYSIFANEPKFVFGSLVSIKFISETINKLVPSIKSWLPLPLAQLFELIQSLGARNYATWSIRLEMFLICSELWNVVNGIDVVQPSNNPVGLTVWKLRVPKLRHIFYFTVVKSINLSSSTHYFQSCLGPH